MSEPPPGPDTTATNSPPLRPLVATLADVADLALYCGYVEDGKQLPFLTSSLYNDRSVFLVTHAVSYGTKKRTRLHYLVDKGDSDKLRSVVESAHGGLHVDVYDGRGCSPLYNACLHPHPATAVALVSALLDAGADQLERGWLQSSATILEHAAHNCRTEVVRLLLDRGMGVNAQDPIGDWTPLHCACLNDRHPDTRRLDVEGTIRLLLERGADPTACARIIGTPLHVAAGYAEETAVRLLLATGRVDVNARSSSDWTPLHKAVIYAKAEGITRLLLDAGADVNARDGRGETPLSKALWYKCYGTAILLRERGGHA
jgi:hypothetical protein